MMLRITLATVAKKPGHRGEREGNRKAIAQGMPVETGEPVEDYRILCGHGCIGHPAFPAPSSWRVALRPLTSGANELAKLGQRLSRECGLTSGRPGHRAGTHTAYQFIHAVRLMSSHTTCADG